MACCHFVLSISMRRTKIFCIKSQTEKKNKINSIDHVVIRMHFNWIWCTSECVITFKSGKWTHSNRRTACHGTIFNSPSIGSFHFTRRKWTITNMVRIRLHIVNGVMRNINTDTATNFNINCKRMTAASKHERITWTLLLSNLFTQASTVNSSQNSKTKKLKKRWVDLRNEHKAISYPLLVDISVHDTLIGTHYTLQWFQQIQTFHQILWITRPIYRFDFLHSFVVSVCFCFCFCFISFTRSSISVLLNCIRIRS